MGESRDGKNQKGERHEGEACRMKELQTKQVESAGCQGRPKVGAADLSGCAAESEPEKMHDGDILEENHKVMQEKTNMFSKKPAS